MNKDKFIKMLEQAKEDEYGRLYDRHFWNDDTLYCHVVSTRHNEDIEYKEPKRIKELRLTAPTNYMKYMQDKINELVKVSNKYAMLLEKRDVSDVEN